MSGIMEDIAYLSQEIGPRPAGTEEEQQAALYIADQMQKRTGFSSGIEDFNAALQPGIAELICFGVAALASLIAIVFGAFVIPAFLITLVCAILYAFELMDRPLLSHAFERGVSQNVVARYSPSGPAAQRNRKIILVAGYDSGKVQAELGGALFKAYPMLQKASAIGLVALPIIWLIRSLFLLHATGGAVVFFNLLAAIALILACVPVALFLMHKAATYNEAANNNAAGVATMLEVARLISDGAMSEEELAAHDSPRVHGAEEAYAAGVVPEGAELVYETCEPQTEEQRLASAKAAVAALTGRPIRDYDPVERFGPLPFEPGTQPAQEDSYATGLADEQQVEDPSGIGVGGDAFAADSSEVEGLSVQDDVDLPQGFESPFRAADTDGVASADNAGSMPEDEDDYYSLEAYSDERYVETADGLLADEAPEAALGATVDEEGSSLGSERPMAATASTAAAPAAPASNEPAWYTTGRAKAVKPADADSTPVRRSRYADALEAALTSSQEHIEQAARMLDEGTIERISQMQRNIENKRTASGLPYDAPLQDILASAPAAEAADVTAVEELASEDQEEREGAYAVEAPVAATEEPVGQHDAKEAVAQGTEEEDGPYLGSSEFAQASPGEREFSADAALAADSEPAPGDEVDLDQKFDQVLAGDATIAMPPVTFGTLGYAQGAQSPATQPVSPAPADAAPLASDSSAAESDAPIHDFSQIAPVPAREVAPGLQDQLPLGDTPEPSAPRRNPLVSERIPRIDSNPPISVIQDEAPTESLVAQSGDSAELADEAAENERLANERRAALLNAIPSLSGEFSPAPLSFDEQSTEVSKTGSFAAVGSTGPFEPVGDELVADLDPEDRYVEDADDSAFDENTTETGAFAGPGYVEMPESRLGRFFSRFRKKEEEPEETSASEWLDVDDGFNPTEVGAARGGWESFRSDDPDTAEQTFESGLSDGEEEDGSWQGGAFSQIRARLAGQPDPDAVEVEPEEGHESNVLEPSARDSVAPSGYDVVDEEGDRIAEEAKMVYTFRNPDINTEVWFVALGSEGAGNGGIKAFLTEHTSDLRGAIIVNLEATGAGELSFIREEGALLQRKPSSRLKRFLRKASELAGVSLGEGSIAWRNSAASVAMGRGLQAFTLAGMQDGKPAYLGQGDDVLENVSEDVVAENARFVYELIKNM